MKAAELPRPWQTAAIAWCSTLGMEKLLAVTASCLLDPHSFLFRGQFIQDHDIGVFSHRSRVSSQTVYAGFFPRDSQLRGLETMQFLVDPFNPLFSPTLLCHINFEPLGHPWSLTIRSGDAAQMRSPSSASRKLVMPISLLVMETLAG